MTPHRISIHGHEIAYQSAGDGPVVVLIHGMAGCSATWVHVMPVLARRFRVIAPDLLGHGASAKPRGEYSLGAHANVVRDLMGALGHERATLVGQSFGGGVAMQMAYQFPARCERLVLVSSGGLGREVGGVLRALSMPGAEHVLALACSTALRDGARRMSQWLGKVGLHLSPVLDEIGRSWDSLALSDARQAFFRTLRSVIDQSGQCVSASDRLYLTAHVPTLIIWGAKDGLIPVAHARAAHEAMAGSRLEIFEESGHFPHCESPVRFTDTLVDFIESTEPAKISERELCDLLRAGRESRDCQPSLSGSEPM